MRPRRALVLLAASTAVILGLVALAVYVSWTLAALLGFLYPLLMTVGLAAVPGDGREPDAATGLLVGVVGFVTFLSGITAWNNLALSTGRDVTAVVVHEKVKDTGHGSKAWFYTLSQDGTGTVPGGPLEQGSPRFAPGDHVTVRMDPAGRVAPKLPGEAGSPAGLLGFLGGTALTAAVIPWSARRPRPPRPGPSPGRRPAERLRATAQRLRRQTGLRLAAVAAAYDTLWLLFFLLSRHSPSAAVIVSVAYLLSMPAFLGWLDTGGGRYTPRVRVPLAVGLAFLALGAALYVLL
ncbi:hypothetical protein [Kitasatospora sp. NPDC101183]|uniref:hypothetical protein n=1 Tax=Kitasatospora sp. NPDC101183 TaxID=3364100 RepID=UPI0038274AC8